MALIFEFKICHQKGISVVQISTLLLKSLSLWNYAIIDKIHLFEELFLWLEMLNLMPKKSQHKIWVKNLKTLGWFYQYLINMSFMLRRSTIIILSEYFILKLTMEIYVQKLNLKKLEACKLLLETHKNSLILILNSHLTQYSNWNRLILSIKDAESSYK